MHFDTMRFWERSKEEDAGIWESGDRFRRGKKLQEVTEAEEDRNQLSELTIYILLQIKLPLQALWKFLS